MLLGKDGWVGQAKDAPVVSGDDDPPDEVLANSAASKVDATYETVKLGGSTIPAAHVKKIVSDESVTNEDFRKANSAVQARLYKEAGDAFSAVAEHLAGMGKQDALWSAVQAYQAAGLPDETNGAIDALMTAFPKTFYFAPAYTIRARVFLAKGDVESAKKAFAAIAAEKGMNPRDAYRAEYMRIFLTEEAQKQVEAARGDYQKLIDTISRGDPAIGGTASQLATVGLANTLLQGKKPAEAAAL
jgi:tetratricopeptide (TPR) repeat protein